MRKIAFAVFAYFMVCGGAAGQSQGEPPTPPACRPSAAGIIDFAACADAAPRGSDVRAWALINAGTAAYQRQDFATAVQLYDEAEPPHGQHLYSDPSFHAFKADAYNHVGRTSEALENARTAWRFLSNPSALPPEWRRLESDSLTHIDVEAVYGLILPILKAGNDPAFAPALAAYTALPLGDWQDYANRAAALDEMGDKASALRLNTQALGMQPDNPQILNTQCYVLAELGRGQEALPYCTHALQLAPDVGAVHDSYATALAATGDCVHATAERDAARRLDPVTVEYQSPIACPPVPVRGSNQASAQAEPDIPPPSSIDDAGVRAWIARYIRADGWTLMGADRSAVAFGGPDGVAVLDDGTLRATIRHEYYEPQDLGGNTMRSSVQVRIINCQTRLERIISFHIFDRNNLHGVEADREIPNATWSTPTPGSLYVTALDRVCAAPSQGVRRN